MRVALDIEEEHALVLEPAAGRTRLTLVHQRGDRRSALHRNLARALRVRCDHGSYALDPATDSVVLDAPRELELDGVVVARVDGAPREPYRLSAFECRYLAEYGRLHAIPSGAVPRPRLVTDLHTHFGGCVAAAALIELGARHGVVYPAALLGEVGIRAQADIPVGELPAPMRAALARCLEVPTERRITFVEMERIYRLRSPLTKHPDMFVPLLERIAADYAAMGVGYVELSLGDITRASRLRAVHQHVPAIEAASGVTLRFLAAMSRHDDLEWDLDYIDRLRELGPSPYLVGVDFMGHETNSTRAFARQIGEVCRWASAERPGFVVRVHAGENPAHPENVRVALDCVAGYDVGLRIGHGLFGVDDETLERLAATGTIVEFNLNSNFALNNIQTVSEAPIHRYLRRGVQVVLGSDGYGIYGSRPELEARAAWLCGVDDDGFARIGAAEAAYLEQRRSADAATRADFEVPDDRAPVHFSPEVVARTRAAWEARDRALMARIDELEIERLDRDGLESWLDGRRCLSIAGAWKHSWDRLSEAEQARVRALLQELFDGLDPDSTAVLTGGTRHGVEGEVAAQARRRGVPHVGILVADTPPSGLERGLITHAFVAADSLHGKADALYRLVRRAGGVALFVGGGNIVSDEIQTAHNLRVAYLLDAHTPGASHAHARQQPQRGFASAREVLAVVRDEPAARSGEPLRHPGPNPTADVVLTRRHPRTRAVEVLLIRRDVDAAAEGGAWALPGGFAATTAPPGEAWRADVETEAETALRELFEETGLALAQHAALLRPVGVYEGGGRDPRDDARAWSRSSAFSLMLPEALADAPIAGADDACDARWFAADALPLRLAFDHARIIADALSGREA